MDIIDIDQLAGAVQENLSNHLSVLLSKDMGIEPTGKSDVERNITGKSTAVFIRSVRLQKAKDLIQTTDKTISEIAYEVGFNDPSWFSRAFKDEFGHAPSNTK